jgi:hypothetical protein
MLLAIVPSIAAITSNLLAIAPAREPSHPNSGPPALSHQLRQSSACASTATVLRDFQDIEHGLGGDALNAVIAGLTAQSL